MNYLTINLLSRYKGIEEYRGREYFVAPVVMLTEGVHAGSGGPLFYPESELAKTATAWNGVPIVLYHPTGPDGLGISANTPGVIEKQGVGTIKNAAWEMGKLRADAWIDVERLGSLAHDVLDKLMRDGFVMEVSTGLFTDNIHQPGWHGGKNFEYVAKNHRPDHLALLPTGVGACSVADGCGLLQTNEEPDIMYYQNFQAKGAPLFGYYQGPPVNHNEYGRDKPLTMPVMNFGNPRGGDDDDRLPCRCAGAHHGGYGDDLFEPLTMPTMNFGSPCGCRGAGADHGRGYGPDEPLTMPTMNFGTPVEPTRSYDPHEPLTMPTMDFGGPVEPTRNCDADEPLTMPTMNFGQPYGGAGANTIGPFGGTGEPLTMPKMIF